MEPLTISHGLVTHSIRSKHTAMRILGYICHSSPGHQPDLKDGVPSNINQPRPYLPPGSMAATVPLLPHPSLTWPTYQTRCTFRLRSSLKNRDTWISNAMDSNGIYITMTECIQYYCTPIVSITSSLGIPRGTIASVAITPLDSKQ
jgi:hypothetical protein